jgi:uncharacterized protein GlcG (DUF336 family)
MMKLGYALGMGLLACVLALGGHSPSVVVAEPGYAGHDVDLAAAMRVIGAGLTKSKELDLKMNITVLDAGGNLKAFVRMDGAYLGSMDISMKKAKTSRYFDAPSEVIGGMSQPGGPLYGIESTSGGLVTFGGGLPLKNSEGVVIGSVGVSGSSVENDMAVAEAAAKAF